MKYIRYFIAIMMLILIIMWWNTPVGSAQEANTASGIQFLMVGFIGVSLIEMAKDVIDYAKR